MTDISLVTGLIIFSALIGIPILAFCFFGKQFYDVSKTEEKERTTKEADG